MTVSHRACHAPLATAAHGVCRTIVHGPMTRVEVRIILVKQDGEEGEGHVVSLWVEGAWLAMRCEEKCAHGCVCLCGVRVWSGEEKSAAVLRKRCGTLLPAHSVGIISPRFSPAFYFAC